jgi:hypothetical protein
MREEEEVYSLYFAPQIVRFTTQSGVVRTLIAGWLGGHRTLCSGKGFAPQSSGGV